MPPHFERPIPGTQTIPAGVDFLECRVIWVAFAVVKADRLLHRFKPLRNHAHSVEAGWKLVRLDRGAAGPI